MYTVRLYNYWVQQEEEIPPFLLTDTLAPHYLPEQEHAHAAYLYYRGQGLSVIFALYQALLDHQGVFLGKETTW